MLSRIAALLPLCSHVRVLVSAARSKESSFLQRRLWRVPSAPNPSSFGTGRLRSASRFSASFLHSCDVLRVVVLAVTVQGRTNAQKKLECVTETVAVIAIKRIGAVVEGELGAESDVDA